MNHAAILLLACCVLACGRSQETDSRDSRRARPALGALSAYSAAYLALWLLLWADPGSFVEWYFD